MNQRFSFNCFPHIAFCFAFVLFAMQDDVVHADTLVGKTMEDSAFLRVPEGMAASDSFTVAKAPPRIDLTIIEGLPDKGKGTLWSTWGDGCLASNGKYYTSIGDHLGRDATSHLYEYDPKTLRLKLVVDLFRDLKQTKGQYGHGKVHSGIHEDRDGNIWFSSYWGKHREVEAAFGPEYQGSVVLRYQPATGNLDNLGAIVPKQGLPTSHFDAEKSLLYFYAVYENNLAVYDTKKRKLLFLGGADLIAGNRAFMRDAKGNVYFSGKDECLHYYNPTTNKLHATKAKLPAGDAESKKGNTLRAGISSPAKDGSIYGMTAQGRLFRFDPATEKIKDMGPNFTTGHYTAVMALSPDQKYIYFVPGAHGSSTRVGTPVVQVELATGKRKVIAFLLDTLQKKFNYKIGGTYNLKIDAAGERLFITFNGNDYEPQSAKNIAFGKPCVVVVHIPDSER